MFELVDAFEEVMGARDEYFRLRKELDSDYCYDPVGYLQNQCDEALQNYEKAIESLLDFKQPR